MLAHTPCTLAPYARINIFLAIISISHARKNFKKNINIPLLKSSIAFCSLIRKRLMPKKPTVRKFAKPNRSRILQTQIVFWFARRILSNYTYRVLQTVFTMEKRRFFAVFRIFTKSCNTYSVLCRFVGIRQNPIISQNFVRCPSQSRLSNPSCRIPS